MEIEEAHARAGIINREAVRDGLYMGGINVVVSLLSWLVNPMLFISSKPAGILYMVLVLVMQCVFLLSIKRTLGKYWTFGEVFRASMIIVLISGFIYALWIALLYNVIDVSLGDRVVAKIKDVTAQAMEDMGMGDKSDEVMRKLNQQDNQPGHILNIVKQFLSGIAFWAVISLILALIFKKNRPVFTAGS